MKPSTRNVLVYTNRGMMYKVTHLSSFYFTVLINILVGILKTRISR